MPNWNQLPNLVTVKKTAVLICRIKMHGKNQTITLFIKDDIEKN